MLKRKGFLVGFVVITLIIGVLLSFQSVQAAAVLLSEGKTASASSSQSQNPPSAANDGNTNTRWAASASSYPQWWKVDLGAGYSLNRVDITWYNGGSRSYKYRIEVSSNNSTFTTVVDKTGNTAYGNTSDSFTAAGRYVRVTVTGSSVGWASANEIKVYGPGSSTPTPTATATPTPNGSEVIQTIISATASSAVQPAGNSCDGNTNSRWESSFSDPQWIYWDLGSNKSLAKIAIEWEVAGAANYTIQGSTNATGWTNLATVTNSSTVNHNIITTDISGSYRYVRMYGTSRTTGYGYSIFETRIYGYGSATPTPTREATATPTPTRSVTATPTPGETEVIAPISSATASSAVQPAGNSCDGNTNSRWESSSSDPQWIYWDLGSNKSLAKIAIEWEVAGAANYTIQGSTNATTWTNLATVTNSSTVNHNTITTNISGSYRYVRMYGTSRTTGWGYSIFETRIYVLGSATPTPTNPPGTVTPTPIVGPTATPPSTIDWGPNVYIFSPSQSMSSIQSQVDSIYAQQDDNQFGSQRYAFFFRPGSYNLNIPVGYYTSIVGLGQRPDDVTITGSVRCEADWMGGNATCNFWRTAENYSVIPTYSSNPTAPSGTETWAASQAAPMRRVHIRGNLSLWDPLPPNYDGAWSSGGFIVDSKVDGNIASASQQQYFTRNTQMGSWSGANWNMVFLGDVGAPANAWPSPPYTVIGQTPIIREKPFLYIDSAGNYFVFKPAIRTNASGITWAGGMGAGTSLSVLNQFYVAKPGDTAAKLNDLLNQGKHLLFTPGIYQLTAPLQVNRPDTIIMGIGLATLMPINGTAAIKVADVDGVTIAGLLLDAGATNCPVLLEVGPRGSSANHAGNPIFIFDIFCRVGGAAVGKATNCVEINSHNTVVDHFWLWRADHGAGVGWTVNTTTNGLIVNGNNVTIYGLFVEHFHQYQVIWNGNGGRTYFYQSEAPYDAPNQAAWMSMNGAKNGWASYKVSDSVSTHEAWGLGVYCVYTVDQSIKLHSAIEAPVKSGVKFHHMVIVTLGYQGEITHVINDLGGPVTNSGPMTAQWNEFP